MTWFAIADHKQQRFSRHGLAIDRHDSPILNTAAGSILPRGSLMIEASVTGSSRPEPLITYRDPDGAIGRSLCLSAIPGGGVSFLATLGRATRHAAVRHPIDGRDGTLRVTYSWDTVQNWARLAIERPGQARAITARIEDPLPILVSDIHDMMMVRRVLSPNLIFAAVSNQIEPIGPCPGLSADLPIDTPRGPTDAGHLRRGDTIGRDGVPVLQSVARRVPSLGSFRPIRLRAPYFGLTRDVIVAPHQRLILSGIDVEYMFGHEAVLVPAAHLVNGSAARFEPSGPVTRYVQLVLPSHDALDSKGTQLESLYIGRMRRDPVALEASVLAACPRASLPEHAKPIHPVLGQFEAVTLAGSRAA